MAEHGHPRPAQRHQQVGYRPGQRHQRHVALGLAQAMVVDRHRLGPAEDEAAEYRHYRRHQHRADRVDMAQWIETEPALGLGGRIATTQRYPAMRDFMQGNRQQQRRRQNHEKLNRIECLHGAIIRRPSRHGPERTR